MDFLPIFMNLRQQPCLVVGGGEVALRKTSLLREAGAKVTVVAPVLDAEFANWSDVICIGECYRPEFLQGCVLVIAATDNAVVNQTVSEQARALNVPVNVVDAPELCSFIMPAILERDSLVVAFSTGGNAPVLARLLRGKLETVIPQQYGQLVKLAAEFRDEVKRVLPDVTTRRVFWEDVFEGDIAERVFAGDFAGARVMLQAKLEANISVALQGEVYLIGAGPGDPELLTFKALRLMQKADVVLYDNLVPKQIVDMTRRDATRMYVGKRRNNHALPQQDINMLLVKLALEGKRVVRLKGGDPFIFGRGGEEIETLVENGIGFQIVPGITAASGVASYAGIPLTHRDYAQSCVFVTGHLKDGTMNLDWAALARENQTVVFYMGSHGLDVLCAALLAHGKPADTPIAMVQQGTTQNQKVLTATLATMPAIFKQTPLQPPTLIIVGGVVALREKLKWFEPTGLV